MTRFNDLPLRPASRAALAALGIDTPTPIQAAALPSLLAGNDLIGQARTGSGKTIAFALPLVEHLDERQRTVQALVLTPTRELASQVAGVVRDLARGRGLRTLLLVGGLSAGPQTTALREGVHVVVGTPGRVLDHVRQGTLRLDHLRLLVLDEADEMLDRGFGPDVERIIAATSKERQTALFTATVPDWLGQIAAKYMRSPVTVRVDRDSQPVEHVEHTVYDVPEGGKLPALRELLDSRPPGVTLVFGRTKHGVRKLAKQLAALGYPAAALQGNMSQNARDRVMADFRSGATPILLATNVAARGLDVEDIGQVINYELPETAGLLTHRVGRTGRMGRAGEAITLLAPTDEEAWRKLQRDLKRPPKRQLWRGHHHPATGTTPSTSALRESVVAATSAASDRSGPGPARIDTPMRTANRGTGVPRPGASDPPRIDVPTRAAATPVPPAVEPGRPAGPTRTMRRRRRFRAPVSART